MRATYRKLLSIMTQCFPVAQRCPVAQYCPVAQRCPGNLLQYRKVSSLTQTASTVRVYYQINP